MYPILARYGPYFLYSYTVAMGLGVLAAVSLTRRLARSDAPEKWMDGLVIMLIAALVGGRMGFVWARTDYFGQAPAEAWQIWQGGLSYHAALLVGLVTLWAWTLYQKRPFSDYAALFAPALALLSAFGWAACWLEGCAYGRETVIGWLAADLPDEFGVFALRYQTQLVGATLALLVLGLVLWLRRRWPPGACFWFAVSALSLSHLAAGLLRGDPMPQLGPLRLDVVADGLLALIGAVLVQYELRHSRRGG